MNLRLHRVANPRVFSSFLVFGNLVQKIQKKIIIILFMHDVKGSEVWEII